MYVNARAIIERWTNHGTMILIQVRNKPYEGGKWLELPGGRVEEFESLVSALKREIREETGLEVTYIEGLSARMETGSLDANVECLAPFVSVLTYLVFRATLKDLLPVQLRLSQNIRNEFSVHFLIELTFT